MIDNFVPQPYPLECSADGETWQLVIGWQKLNEVRLVPVVADGLAAIIDAAGLRFRQAAPPTSPLARAAALGSMAAPVAPSRSARVGSSARRPTSA